MSVGGNKGIVRVPNFFRLVHRFGICVCVFECNGVGMYLHSFFYFRRSHSGAHTKYDLRFPSFFFCVCFVVKCSRLVYVLLLVLVS